MELRGEGRDESRDDDDGHAGGVCAVDAVVLGWLGRDAVALDGVTYALLLAVGLAGLEAGAAHGLARGARQGDLVRGVLHL